MIPVPWSAAIEDSEESSSSSGGAPTAAPADMSLYLKHFLSVQSRVHVKRRQGLRRQTSTDTVRTEPSRLRMQLVPRAPPDDDFRSVEENTGRAFCDAIRSSDTTRSRPVALLPQPPEQPRANMINSKSPLAHTSASRTRLSQGAKTFSPAQFAGDSRNSVSSVVVSPRDRRDAPPRNRDSLSRDPPRTPASSMTARSRPVPKTASTSRAATAERPKKLSSSSSTGNRVSSESKTSPRTTPRTEYMSLGSAASKSTMPTEGELVPPPTPPGKSSSKLYKMSSELYEEAPRPKAQPKTAEELPIDRKNVGMKRQNSEPPGRPRVMKDRVEEVLDAEEQSPTPQSVVPRRRRIVQPTVQLELLAPSRLRKPRVWGETVLQPDKPPPDKPIVRELVASPQLNAHRLHESRSPDYGTESFVRRPRMYPQEHGKVSSAHSPMQLAQQDPRRSARRPPLQQGTLMPGNLAPEGVLLEHSRSIEGVLVTPEKSAVSRMSTSNAAELRRRRSALTSKVIREIGSSTIIDPSDLELVCTNGCRIKLSDYLRYGGSRGDVNVYRINSGTFCSVYLGRLYGRDVAVKCPHQRLLESDSSMMVHRALAEWKILSQISHDNIVHLLGGVIIDGDTIWLVTEFVHGGDVYNLLYTRQAGRPARTILSPYVRLKLMEELASGIAYLHSRGVAHKDIKCNNLLMTSDGVLRICDFGDAEVMTQKYLQCCTAATWQYVSPELICGEDPARPVGATELVDVWAMGCVFLEILGCPTPYLHLLEAVPEEAQRDKLRALYLNGTLQSQLNVPSNLPASVKKLIAYTLQFQPSKRHTAQQVLAYIQTHMQQLLGDIDLWITHGGLRPPVRLGNMPSASGNLPPAAALGAPLSPGTISPHLQMSPTQSYAEYQPANFWPALRMPHLSPLSPRTNTHYPGFHA